MKDVEARPWRFDQSSILRDTAATHKQATLSIGESDFTAGGKESADTFVQSPIAFRFGRAI